MPKALKTVTIPAGGSQSEAFDLEGFELAGVIMPAAWDAAALTLLASVGPNGTFDRVDDDAGTEWSLTVAASRVVGVGTPAKAGATRGLRWVKLRSGTAALPVNQVAARTIHVLLERSY